MTPAVVSAQNCTAATAMTGFTPYYVDCAGAFGGNLNGAGSELTFLSNEFGHTFFYQGKSDDALAGPFLSNPNNQTSGTLDFNSTIYGMFVVGVKASNTYSFYLFDAGITGLTSVPFETIGSATNSKGKAQGLSHVALYSTDDTPFIVDCLPGAPGCGQTTVPEPSTYVLMGSGLLALGVVSRRRRRA